MNEPKNEREEATINRPIETMHDETTVNPSDEATVRGLYQQLIDGWNRGSGAAFAAVFAEDGDLVAFDGTHFKGRQEIARFHQELFDRWMKGTRLVGQVEDVRFLSSDVALMHAVGSTVMRGKAEPSPERDSIQTLVATRQGGEWRLAAFQNTRVRIIRNAATFLVWTLSDQLWKVFRLNENGKGENGINETKVNDPGSSEFSAPLGSAASSRPAFVRGASNVPIDAVMEEAQRPSGPLKTCLRAQQLLRRPRQPPL